MVPMTGAETDIDRALLWDAAATHLRRMTTTMTVAAPLVATALDATITAGAHRPASSMTGVTSVMDVRHLVVACLMSMAHRARVTLTILMMLGPDLHLVATTTLI